MFIPKMGGLPRTGSSYDTAGIGFARDWADLGNGTIYSRRLKLWSVKTPALMIPGAVGVHATNQIQQVVNYGDGVGVWKTGCNMTAADLVTNGGLFYVCASTHVSGTFNDDLAAGKWRQTTWIASAASLAWPTPVAKNYANALAQIANDLNAVGGYAGFTDWRMPTDIEWLCMMHRGLGADYALRVDPLWPFTLYQAATPTNYWASTSPGDQSGTPATYGLFARFGALVAAIDIQAKTNTYYVRPVRGPGGA